MMLDECFVLVGHLPNVRSLSILVKSDQGMRDIIWGVFFVPQLGPRGVVFRNLVPPNFCQACLIVQLRISNSKEPIFSLQSLSQLTSSQRWLLLLHPQRKDLYRDWIAFKTHLGAAKTEKRYKGMDCRVNLSRTARLGRLREQKVQEFRWFSSLSRSFFKEACLMAASKRGTPKYLEGG